MLTRTSLTIRLHPDDDVVIARTQLLGGTLLAEENVTVSGLVCIQKGSLNSLYISMKLRNSSSDHAKNVSAGK